MSLIAFSMNPFKPIKRDINYLFPPSLNDWLPEQHLARFVVEIVEQLDLSTLERSYRRTGSAPFHPALLLSILIYGYATGGIESRKLEHATYDSIAFRFVSADEHPDHDTLNTFRKRFLKQIEALMVQVLLIARTLGVLKLGNIALDGSKIKAIASARAKIEARADDRFEQEQAEYQTKVAKREAKSRESGKPPRGNPPVPPQAGARNRDQINLTDEESRIMPVSGGGFEQCYNGQIAVDMESLLIVMTDTVQATNDKQQLANVRGELNLVALAWNLKRMFNLKGAIPA